MPPVTKKLSSLIPLLGGMVLFLFNVVASATLLTVSAKADVNNLVIAAAASKPVAHAQKKCRNCGLVESVREIAANSQTSSTPPVGGAMDSQIGAGRNQDLATTGATMGGNSRENSSASGKKYEIVVRLDDGSTRTLHETHTPMWRPGDRVSINNDTIQLNQ